MVEVKHLTAGYPGNPVLEDLELTLPGGQVTVIAGPNGCGKSTLLKALAEILPHTSGEILVDGTDLSLLTTRETARRVAYLPQNRQVPEITALRLVLHGRFPYLSYPRRYSKQDLAAAREAMARLNISELEDRFVQTLSGGTRQKVYIAMALAQDTPVVLLDEPTTFLDISHQLQTMEQARFLAKEGKTVVLVLHDLTMALQTADQLVVMEQGRIAAQGCPEEVFTSGCLGRVFGVEVARVSTPEGWQYYYNTKESG